ncbi:unnamed protein product, partial [Scytosiphon promiscuus]
MCRGLWLRHGHRDARRILMRARSETEHASNCTSAGRGRSHRGDALSFQNGLLNKLIRERISAKCALTRRHLMRTKLLATAAIAALCFGGPAFADESEALINQSGVSNNADIDQTEGLENEGYIDQTGDENSASITQKHTPPGSQIYSIATNTADID